jgi:hypothetical protein
MREMRRMGGGERVRSKDGLPSYSFSKGQINLHLAGSGTSSNVEWRKGRREKENLSTSSYARRPVNEEN